MKICVYRKNVVILQSLLKRHAFCCCYVKENDIDKQKYIFKWQNR